jgi:hypothetical protein
MSGVKDAGLRLRIEKELRDEFVGACRSEGKAASQVLREYMRAYVANVRRQSQPDLFEVTQSVARNRAL